MKFLGQVVHVILILIKLIKLFSEKLESIYNPLKSITSPFDLIERENKGNIAVFKDSPNALEKQR